MRHRMWMGPRGYEQWVPQAAISPQFTTSRFASSTALLNGGATIRQSKARHQVYALTWNAGSWDDIMPIRNMADGVWDTDDGPTLVYWHDATAAARNLLPQMWASPGIGVTDGPSLLRGNRPNAAVYPQHPFGLPARAASYGPGGTPRRVYVPIPPGFRAHFGWVGSGSGQVELRQATATGANGTQTPDPISGNGQFTSATVDRGGDVIGVEVGLAGTAPVSIRAMMLQVLPIGRSPRTNVPFSPGMGHSGCQFTDGVGLTPLSVPLDLVPASATLEETGAWL